MGIQGLLPLLKDIHNPTHVKEYKGKTIGIDAYVWLHRGAYACAQELVLGQPTDKFIRYAMHKINMLKHFGITPYLVFDGDKLPSKAHTEDDRDKRRAENKSRAEKCLAAGEKEQARDLFSKCLDISPAIAYQLIKVLRREKVSYIVAPYEADAQLAYMEKEGIIDGIITEDSDMLVFGCKRVLFKLDSDGGCIEILQSKLTANKSVSFVGWTIHEFRQMSILSGCDYLESINGMGLKNAHRLLRRYKTVDKVLQAVRLEGKLRVPPTYAHDFRRAELTFLHQRVIDPRNMTLTTITPIPAGVDDLAMDFIGPPIPAHQVPGLASGELDPITREPVLDIMPNRDTSASQQQQQPSKPRAGAFSSASSKASQKPVRDPRQPTLAGFFPQSSQTASSSKSALSAPKQAGRTSIASMLMSTSQPSRSRPSTVLRPKDVNRGHQAPLVSSSPPDASLCLRTRTNAFATQPLVETNGKFKVQKKKDSAENIDTSVVEDTSRYFQLNGGVSPESKRRARNEADEEMEALETISSAAGSSPVRPERGGGASKRSAVRKGLTTTPVVDFSQFRFGAGSTWDCDDLSSNASSNQKKRQREAELDDAYEAQDVENAKFRNVQRPSPRSIIRVQQKLHANRTGQVVTIPSPTPTSNITSSPSSSPIFDKFAWEERTPTARRNVAAAVDSLSDEACDIEEEVDDEERTPRLQNEGKGKGRAVDTAHSPRIGVEEEWEFDAPRIDSSPLQLLHDRDHHSRNSPHESQLGDDWASEVLIRASQGSEVVTELSDDPVHVGGSSPSNWGEEPVRNVDVRASLRREAYARTSGGRSGPTNPLKRRRPAAVLAFPTGAEEEEEEGEMESGLAYVIKDAKSLNGPYGELGFASQPVQQQGSSSLRMAEDDRSRGGMLAPAPGGRPIPKPISRSSSGPASLRSIGEQARIQGRQQRQARPSKAGGNSEQQAEPKRQRLNLRGGDAPAGRPPLQALNLATYRYLT
ncbi:hypothetical protein A4X13_0g4231 [Tilletia indica]|uniref:Uncharacterized protein n=1 Tax=Tilletia indica TaxID=43049 RepID=A0A177TRE2_9BASI|nr:hypothetical protein A4X13_0g4231 [Tilletia indica]